MAESIGKVQAYRPVFRALGYAYAGETARFRIKLEVNRPSDELKVKVSGSEAKVLSVSPVTINAGQTGEYYDASELEVTCKSAFSNELAIEVYAKDELVRKMIFVPNRNIRSVDVAIVTVTTQNSEGGRRQPDKALLRGVERLLQQAYIVPNFRFYELDLSQPAEGTIETVSNSITRTSTPAKILEIEKFGGNKYVDKLSVNITNTESLFDILWKNEGKIGTGRPIAKLRFINLHNFLNQMLNYTHKAESHLLNECYKWYYYRCDSLSRMDFPPRQLDTTLFHTKGNGFQLDTLYPNGIYETQERDYKDDYECSIRHKDSLIWNILEYDRTDAKLVKWHREFIRGGGILGYTIEYTKDGNVKEFYSENGWFYGKEGYTEPTYSIYQLIDKLKQENFDLFNHVAIYPGGWKYSNPDSTTYMKWGWCVDIEDTTENVELDIIERLYDGQTGELIDQARRKWYK